MTAWVIHSFLSGLCQIEVSLTENKSEIWSETTLMVCFGQYNEDTAGYSKIKEIMPVLQHTVRLLSIFQCVF